MNLRLPDSSKPSKRRRLWEVDPSTYVPVGKFGSRERTFELFRAFGKYVLWGLILTYPFTLPLIGLLFGGLAFWGAFGGSVFIMAVLLRRFGLSKNFEGREISLVKSLIGLGGGFLCALGFFLGLVFIQGWVFPVTLGLLGLFFFVALRKDRF